MVVLVRNYFELIVEQNDVGQIVSPTDEHDIKAPGVLLVAQNLSECEAFCDRILSPGKVEKHLALDLKQGSHLLTLAGCLADLFFLGFDVRHAIQNVLLSFPLANSDD